MEWNTKKPRRPVARWEQEEVSTTRPSPETVLRIGQTGRDQVNYTSTAAVFGFCFLGCFLGQARLPHESYKNLWRLLVRIF